MGFIEEIKGKNYVILQGIPDKQSESSQIQEIKTALIEEKSLVAPPPRTIVPPPVIQPKGATLTAAIADDYCRRRVFITHGKNHNLVEPIQKLLEYGVGPVVSIEKQSVSKPVPEKVMDDMRFRSGDYTC